MLTAIVLASILVPILFFIECMKEGAHIREVGEQKARDEQQRHARQAKAKARRIANLRF